MIGICFLSGLSAVIILANEKLKCNTIGIISQTKIIQSHSRIATRPSLYYDFNFKLNKIYSIGGHVDNAILNVGWGSEQFVFANEWIKKHPAGSTVDINYSCLLPRISYISNEDTRTWSGFVYSTFFWWIILIGGIIGMFTSLYLVSKRLFKF